MLKGRYVLFTFCVAILIISLIFIFREKSAPIIIPNQISRIVLIWREPCGSSQGVEYVGDIILSQSKLYLMDGMSRKYELIAIPLCADSYRLHLISDNPKESVRFGLILNGMLMQSDRIVYDLSRLVSYLKSSQDLGRRLSEDEVNRMK